MRLISFLKGRHIQKKSNALGNNNLTYGAVEVYLAMLSVTGGLAGMKRFGFLHSEDFTRVFPYNSLLNLTYLVMNELPGKNYENILVTVSQTMYFPFLKQMRVFFFSLGCFIQ